jgi:hypothetical protein
VLLMRGIGSYNQIGAEEMSECVLCIGVNVLPQKIKMG